MPAHDWTRVEAGIFHSFHLSWIGEITKSLNSGLLPPDYYALGEQVAGGIGPDVLTLRQPSHPESNGNPDSAGSVSGAVAVATAPPRVRFTVSAEDHEYVRRQRALSIRHVSNHRIIALMEILSPGTKSGQQPLEALLQKAASALERRIHLLLVDLFPPGPRDPHGIHAALWEYLFGRASEPPGDKPLTLTAYAADTPITAYVEPVAVGDTLPEMPLFLTSDCYVNVPLEATYAAAYAGVPKFYRAVLEA